MTIPDANPLDDLISDDPAVREEIRSNPGALLTARGVEFGGGQSADELRGLLRLHSLIWQGGRIVSRDRFRIDPFDEGLEPHLEIGQIEMPLPLVAGQVEELAIRSRSSATPCGCGGRNCSDAEALRGGFSSLPFTNPFIAWKGNQSA